MASENVHEFTDENFQAEVIDSSTPVLVDFWAEWCQPCKMLTPTIEEVLIRTRRLSTLAEAAKRFRDGGEAVVLVTEGGAAKPGEAVDKLATVFGFDEYALTFGDHHGGALVIVQAQVGLAVHVMQAVEIR